MTAGQTVFHLGCEYRVELIDRATGWVRLRPVGGGRDVSVRLEDLEHD